MIWFRRTSADSALIERIRRAMEGLSLDCLEQLARFAEELAAKQRADKYTGISGAWGWP
jgi:hypothetical protein